MRAKFGVVLLGVLFACTLLLQDIGSDLDRYHVRLISLDAAAQEIAEQTNHVESRQSLNEAVVAVNEHYSRIMELFNEMRATNGEVCITILYWVIQKGYA